MITLIAMTLFSQVTIAQEEQDEVIGVWLSENGDEKIEIFLENGKYQGKLVWLSEPTDSMGNPKLDLKNPNEESRTNELIGTYILVDFIKKGNGNFKNGRIYDAGHGKWYDGLIKVKDGVAKIRGYVGIPLLGKTEVATKVEN